MKKPSINIEKILVIFKSLFIFVACDFTMVKELDINFPARPPKLSVTAILNGRGGTFDIRVMDAHISARTITIIRDGEIRLFEDDVLIRSIPGPFDMSKEITEGGAGWHWGRNGYRFITGGVSTKPGSIYRLEVEVEGYPLAVSSSVMPAAPAVSANMDNSEQIVKNNVKEIVSFGGYRLFNLNNTWNNQNYPDRYWSFSTIMDTPHDVSNYYAIDVINVDSNGRVLFWGIGASDVSILLDGLDRELTSNEIVDLYLFPMLITRNLDDASRNFYAAVADIPDYSSNDYSHFENDPNYEKITTNHSLVLRVRNITPATYRYYRSLSWQFAESAGMSALEQPISVVCNIEGGYGSFAVYNTTNITLQEWETYEWRRVEE